MGVVPNLVTGVWVGCEDRAAHFRSIKEGQGAVMALPIWGLYMKACYEDKTLKISKSSFKKPADLSIEVNCDEFNENSKPTDEDISDDIGIDF